MESFEPGDYGPVLAPLIDVDRCRDLGAGVPNEGARDQLSLLAEPVAFAHAAVVDHDMSRSCLAGVWLVHDFLDESHQISQGVETSTGSFWHGVMHRREGDFSNAKYWFRRVGDHPVLARIAPRAARVGLTDWDPFRFVDACQRATDGDDAQICRLVQQIEWEMLFDYCYRAAVGRDA